MSPLSLAIARARWAPKHNQKQQIAVRPELPPPNPHVAPWLPPRLEEIPRVDLRMPPLQRVRRIQQTVADAYRLDLPALLGPRRNRNLVRPRQVAIYIVKQLTGMSLSQIGLRFNRDHTSILHAIRKVEALRRVDLEFEFFLSKLMEDLRD